MNVVTLCTGNVARSVMLGYMLSDLSEGNGWAWQIRTAGTFAIEGQAMSARTLQSLRGLEEIGEHDFTRHRSRQITDDDAAWADVIFASEADHVRFVRDKHPSAAHKVVQLKHFVATAPLEGPIAERVQAVATLEPDVVWDVVDPAGGDQATYDATAQELWDLTMALGVILMDDGDYLG
jgi:protein-tyrosine phosphatase